jgi:hypothetical protein
MEWLDDTVFKWMFHVDHPSFNELLDLISPFLPGHIECKAAYSYGSSITVKTRLAVKLFFLAGGSYFDLHFAWGISYSTFYSNRCVLWLTAEALMLGYPLMMPTG